MINDVALAIGTVLAKDSHGDCLLIATDEECREIARAAINAMRNHFSNTTSSAYDAFIDDVDTAMK